MLRRDIYLPLMTFMIRKYLILFAVWLVYLQFADIFGKPVRRKEIISNDILKYQPKDDRFNEMVNTIIQRNIMNKRANIERQVGEVVMSSYRNKNGNCTLRISPISITTSSVRAFAGPSRIYRSLEYNPSGYQKKRVYCPKMSNKSEEINELRNIHHCHKCTVYIYNNVLKLEPTTTEKCATKPPRFSPSTENAFISLKTVCDLPYYNRLKNNKYHKNESAGEWVKLSDFYSNVQFNDGYVTQNYFPVLKNHEWTTSESYPALIKSNIINNNGEESQISDENLSKYKTNSEIEKSNLCGNEIPETGLQSRDALIHNLRYYGPVLFSRPASPNRKLDTLSKSRKIAYDIQFLNLMKHQATVTDPIREIRTISDEIYDTPRNSETVRDDDNDDDEKDDDSEKDVNNEKMDDYVKYDENLDNDFKILGTTDSPDIFPGKRSANVACHKESIDRKEEEDFGKRNTRLKKNTKKDNDIKSIQSERGGNPLRIPTS